MSSIVFAAFAGKGAREKTRRNRPRPIDRINSDLMAAVRNGDTEEVHGCLSTSANETSAEEAKAILVEAARLGYEKVCREILKQLVELPTSLLLPEDSLNEALLAAVTYDEAAAAAPPPPLPTVPRPSLPGMANARAAPPPLADCALCATLLLERRAGANARQKSGEELTALMLAVSNPTLTITAVLALLDGGATRTMREEAPMGSGQTALSMAARIGDPEVLKVVTDPHYLCRAPSTNGIPVQATDLWSWDALRRGGRGGRRQRQAARRPSARPRLGVDGWPIRPAGAEGAGAPRPGRALRRPQGLNGGCARALHR